MTNSKSRLGGVQIAWGLLTIGFLLVAGLLWILQIDITSIEDCGWYWHDSLDWQHPYNLYHVPGFALTIALLRGVTFGLLPPAIVMMTVAYAGLLCATSAVYRLIEINGGQPQRALEGACLYGFWPCVGVFHAAYPYADDSALAFLFIGLIALQRSHPRAAAALFGLAAVFHKSTWLYIALIVFADICRGQGKSWRDPLALALLGSPIAVLWLMGTWYHGSPAWMFTTSLNVGIERRASWPILDGISAAVSMGGWTGLIKGSLVVGLLLLNIACLYASVRSKEPSRPFAIAISVGCLFYFIFLTKAEIWCAVRFSKLLVLPLAWSVAQRPIKSSRWRLGMYVVVLLVLLTSQLAFLWYVAGVYYPTPY